MNSSALRDCPSPDWIESLRRRYPTERTVDDTLTSRLRRRVERRPMAGCLEDVHASLQSFLRSRVEGPFSVTTVAPLTGGASKEQFVFTLDWTHRGVRRPADRMVLRRDPEESIVATSRTREFQLLRAMEGVVPVPAVHWLDPTGEELGRPALIYSFVAGVQKPATGSSQVTGMGISFNAAQREIIGPQFVRHLASIHTFDPSGHDLSAFELPKVGTTQDVDWQLNWWERTWQEDMLEAVPLLRLAEQWLRANRRALDHCSLVHSDYRTGNYLFDEKSLQLTAILDWELGYFGDRHYDLAWVLVPAFATPDEQGRPLAASLFTREAFIDAYQQASGLSVDEDRLTYYLILAFWRGVIMTLGGALRAAHCGRSHQDIVLTWFAGIGYTLMESLRKALNEVMSVR